MPEIVVYDRKGNKVVLEAIGKGMFEKISRNESGEAERTGDVLNLKTALGCGAYFTEEQHEKFLAKQKKAKGK